MRHPRAHGLRRPASRLGRRSFRPHLETLEDRSVPSITPGNAFTVAGGAVPGPTAVAMAADGHFIVAKLGNAAGGGLTGYTITVQIDNADGSARTGVIAVGQGTTGSAGQLAVAGDAAGDFVVLWDIGPQSWTPDAGILARRFDRTGRPLGDVFQVNQGGLSFIASAAVAMDARGDFLVAWRNRNQDNAYEIDARRYSAAGVAQGNEFQVRASATGPVGTPSVAMDAQGDFIVAWEGAGPSGYGSAVYARRYNAAGQPFAGPFQVSQSTTEAYLPVVAMDAQGDSVISWTGEVAGLGYGLLAQRYNAAGVAQGGEFRVNQFTTGSALSHWVAMDARGDCAFTWEMDPPPTGLGFVPGQFWADMTEEGGGTGIYGRVYTAAGQDLSGEIQVNQGTSGRNSPAGVAMDAGGDVVFTWTNGIDTSQPQFSLNARRYAPTATGYDYDAGTRTLTITVTGGGHSFAYRQATNTGGVWANYTFSLDGVAQTYNTVALAHVVVRFDGTGNTAVLYTNDTYTGDDGQPHETAESLTLGQGGGQLYHTGGAAPFLSLSGFANAWGYLGRADTGTLLASVGVPNRFISGPGSSEMVAPGSHYWIGGAPSVIGYAANADDRAALLGGSGASTFVVSGTVFSSMSGTDASAGWFDNEAIGFTSNAGAAPHAGSSTAYFFAPTGGNVFLGGTAHSSLYRVPGAGGVQYYDVATNFGQVYAVALAGGTDYAYVDDATVNHVIGFRRRA
jgi:hypothetical protein